MGAGDERCVMCGEPVARCTCGYGASVSGEHAGSPRQRLAERARRFHDAAGLIAWYEALSAAERALVAEGYRSRLESLRRRAER